MTKAPQVPTPETRRELGQMPKGDRAKLKADPEDGTTPIANLLLEALAMAHLSGEQKGAVLFLWRRTYGWEVEGRRKTENVISLTEWALALNTHSEYASRLIAGLIQKRVILRRDLGQGKGYSYSMNTRVNEWDKGCLNSEGLSKRYSVPSTKRITPPDTILVMPKESIKESIKETSSKEEGRPQTTRTPATEYLFSQTGRKRWQYRMQKEEFEKAEAEVGFERMKEAIDWALLSGISNIKSIITAARKKHGESRADTRSRGTDSDRRRDRAPTREQYQRSLES